MSSKTTTNVIDMLGDWYAKAPPLPKRWCERLVSIIPILTLIFGIIGIILTIGGLGVFTTTSPLAVVGGPAAMSAYGTGFLMELIYLVGWVLFLAAYPGLKGRKLKGWKLLFWSEVVFLIGGLVSMAILSAIIGALIAFYFLYQIRSYYK